MPRISVIIPLFNGAGTVGEAVRSLLGSTEQDWHAVIVDDGSTDGGASVRAAYAAIGSDVRFTVLSQANVGLAGARNAGLDYLASDAGRTWRGSHIAFLDADDAFSPTGLATLLDTATKHGTAAYGAFQLRRHDPSVTLAESPLIATQAPAHGVLDLGGWLDGVFVVVHSTLLPWEAIADMRFDRQRTRVEDYDLWLRLAARGLRWTAVKPHSPPVCVYRIAPGSMSQDHASMCAHAQRVVCTAHRHARESLLSGVLTSVGLDDIDCTLASQARRIGALALTWATRQALCGPDDPATVITAGETLISAASDIEVTPSGLAGAIIGALSSGMGLAVHAALEPLWQQRIARWANRIELLGRSNPGLAGAVIAECRQRAIPFGDVDQAVLRAIEDADSRGARRVVLMGHGPNARRLERLLPSTRRVVACYALTGGEPARTNRATQSGDITVIADLDAGPYDDALQAARSDPSIETVSWQACRRRLAMTSCIDLVTTPELTPGVPIALAIVLVRGDSVGGVLTWAASAGAAVDKLRQSRPDNRQIRFESLFISLDQSGADSVDRLLDDAEPAERQFCSHLRLGGEIFTGPCQPQGYQVIRAVATAITQRRAAIVMPDTTDLTWIAAHLCASKPGGPKLVAGAWTDDAYNRGLLAHYTPWDGAFASSTAGVAWCKGTAAGFDPATPVAIVPGGAINADKPRHVDRDQSLPLRCVYVGRLDEEQKRISDVLAIASLLHAHNQSLQAHQPHVVLDIIGTGPPELVDAARRCQAQCPGTLAYRGTLSRSEMSAAWASYDVLVLCSAAEGLSVSMQEAMGRGVVPVVTDLPGVDQWVTAGLSGEMLTVGDTVSFVNGLITLSSRRDRLAAMGYRAWESARRVGGIDRAAASLLDLLVAVLARVPHQSGNNRKSLRSRWPAWKSMQASTIAGVSSPPNFVLAAERAARGLAAELPVAESEGLSHLLLAGWAIPNPGLALGDALLRAARDGLHPLVVFPFGQHTRRAIAELSGAGEASLLAKIDCFADDRAAVSESAAGDAFVKNATLCSRGLAPVLSPVAAASLIRGGVATGDRALVIISSDGSEASLVRSEAAGRFRGAGAMVTGLYMLQTVEMSQVSI